ncbi:hypothetical protein ACK32R_15460, partial [Aeromonas dhakensis]|uniref:hypothetical protein n=2 Tax=Aeromonas dhakensis TaxID=196024 RepID=UPI003986B91F
LHAETALGTGRMTSTFECSKKWGDYRAKELLENCFDYFKDIQQIEYRKIYKFVEARTDVDELHVSEADCIVDLYHRYQKEFQPRLESHMVSFAVIAAYVETRGMYV